jgi:hypothetical protein
MSAENLMAHSTEPAEKGHAGGWYQAGNHGGQASAGRGALIASTPRSCGFPAQQWRSCSRRVVWLCSSCPNRLGTSQAALSRTPDVAVDVWNTAKSRMGFLALLICFLPIGSGAASGLWAAVAGDWHAGADTVALVNGVMGGIVSAIGCVVGGYLCDRMDRKFAYCLFGVFIAVGALIMAAAARTQAMFIVFTLLYAFSWD